MGKTTDPLYHLKKDIYEYASQSGGPNQASTYAHMVCQNNLDRAYQISAQGRQMQPEDIVRPR